MNDKKSVFINRELSWLRFNSRVLAQCEKALPPLEKLKFIAIYMTNLDEFYMIRIAGLKQLFAAGVAASGSDGMSPLEQLREIRKYIKDELAIVEKHYKDALKELAQNGKNLFLIQKSPIQNRKKGYGSKKWRLYLYRYPIWRTASSTAD